MQIELSLEGVRLVVGSIVASDRMGGVEFDGSCKFNHDEKMLHQVNESMRYFISNVVVMSSP